VIDGGFVAVTTLQRGHLTGRVIETIVPCWLIDLDRFIDCSVCSAVKLNSLKSSARQSLADFCGRIFTVTVGYNKGSKIAMMRKVCQQFLTKIFLEVRKRRENDVEHLASSSLCFLSFSVLSFPVHYVLWPIFMLSSLPLFISRMESNFLSSCMCRMDAQCTSFNCKSSAIGSLSVSHSVLIQRCDYVLTSYEKE